MTTFVISSGRSAGYSLMSGDTLTVLSGGYDTGTTVGSGATETVLSGGVASGDAILAGGAEVVSLGGVLSGGIDLGVLEVTGSADRTAVGSGGRMTGRRSPAPG